MTAASDRPERRLLLVHAHPDDESIGNGATMARYAAEGAAVTLVTCTLGEGGEVIPPELAELTADRTDTLGEYRIGELTAAMRELGVTDVRFLGGPGRYRDSGMMGLPENDRPDCFWQAPLDEAAGHLVAVVRELRPQVLVSYDEQGGYGHPDHVKAHQVAMRAHELAADPVWRPELGPAWRIAKVYWNRMPRSVIEAGLAATAAAAPFPGVAAPADVPGVVPDELVTTVLDGAAYAGVKAAAMAAHATQITVSGEYFALSNDLGQPLVATEYYQLVRGEPGPELPETDLFAGLGLEAHR
ncbi:MULTISPECIES: N-acetyl-1-D-myo-inositol-2-amino-2-deoxy-alpha-D-glucopyranoside deacetylase [unclassified Kitasatospora]|uniref:N-acetyl-1-D-myo-inositol-2-amino-2-deoxy-alpha- D-glucopyranoside deacetylase n=1 Tax=unclassified Kitasatospora TaxID=2633591 RepID=UPI00070DECAE|nr:MULTISPECIES: N-acetyl-1-D-myo-inositol-2-amino-2-deoxy-alpha-D-glucopyranoside deacetylase [unclassified Kitasatospora]KQV23874.1 N-acetyl-1-D-myo-inositol-2-amino-2-deoxy-alpha-D-glucopyranoside deacetylase [Kitasatospora sp. Root107]KRB67413.1 N-acetyl-1-D-myo-inositol-2-amino-2-deoxy-alpha-D-glucopyranoside deacetylase [Kitasatospora sp. Root187]